MTSTEKKGSDGEEIDNFNNIQDPNTLAKLQEKIGQMTIKKDDDDLHLAVKKRIFAIKKIQLETTKIEANFFKEVHKLEVAYAEKYLSLYKRRAEIVTGKVEPTPEECVIPGGEDLDNEENEINNENTPSAPKGIPDFWLSIFKTTDILHEMVQPHDEPIFKHLDDIRVSFPADSMGFVLEFVFSPNEYFDNEILTKTYHMKSEPDELDPVSFDGPEIIGSEGCTINWKTGKNVTKKVVKKKQRQRGKDTVRWVTKTTKEDSFFNFFDPPEMPDDEDSCDEELEALLTTDFEIGQYIRERIIPKAIWYFTNEVTDIESDMEDGDSGDETTDSSDLSGEDDDQNDNIVANNTVTDVKEGDQQCQQQQQ